MTDQIKQQTRFVFYGFASEYSLAPLHCRMFEAGYDCVEIDGATQDSVAALKAARETDRTRVLLTSQHLYYGKNARALSPRYPFLSAIEAHALLRPDFAVFAPHDLLDPLHADEVPFLRAFDLYLAASEEERCFGSFCPVEVVGWLKFCELHGDPAPPDLRNRAVWLVNYANYVAPSIGVGRWADIVAAAADGRCSIKLAAWPNTAELEAALHARGQHTIVASTPFLQLARHANRFICNGASSVVRECGMLDRTIYLYRDERLLSDGARAELWKVAQECNCRIIHSLDEIEAAEPASSGANTLPSDDSVARAIEALMRHLAGGMAR